MATQTESSEQKKPEKEEKSEPASGTENQQPADKITSSTNSPQKQNKQPQTASNTVNGTSHKKVKPSKMDDFKQFLWDPRTRKCMGRTPIMWGKLLAFYIALYACLAAIWTIFFYMFHQTISERYPRWQLDESLIGSNPGVGYRPQNPLSRVESALISYKDGPNGNYQHWVEDLNNFLRPYDNRTGIKVDCSGSQNRDEDTICPFDTSVIPSECSAAQNFSYSLGSPCVLIKLNRIYGWVPIPYETRPADYPEQAPFKPNAIQITCSGQNDPDKEHIGPIEYYPQGIETKFYPFYNQAGYQSPFVMVHFKNPRHDILIYVECRAWAKNIEHDRYNKRGLTSFELFIEKPPEAESANSTTS